MPQDDAILSFREVSVTAEPPYEVSIAEADFTLRGGELLSVDLGEKQPRTPLADAAEGLVEPLRGRVVFLGRDWRAIKAAEGARLRSHIGRVFDEHGWLSNLDVDENVALPLSYHTGRKREEILEEAQALAESLELGRIPSLRPAFVSRKELKIAQWVRALLGPSRLVILEEPMRGVPDELFENLRQGVEGARERGACVLWISSSRREHDILAAEASLRLKLEGFKLVPVSEDDS